LWGVRKELGLKIVENEKGKNGRTNQNGSKSQRKMRMVKPERRDKCITK